MKNSNPVRQHDRVRILDECVEESSIRGQFGTVTEIDLPYSNIEITLDSGTKVNWPMVGDDPDYRPDYADFLGIFEPDPHIALYARCDRINAWFERMKTEEWSGPVGSIWDGLVTIADAMLADVPQSGGPVDSWQNSVWYLAELEAIAEILEKGIRLLRMERAESREFTTEIDPDAPIA